MTTGTYPASELTEAGASWRKSSYSDGAGNNCVEIADLDAEVGIRDSKNMTGPALVVPATAWASFVTSVATT
ncbi:hypothetical protein CU044_2573 [Streptomyces sp. L-9-10]|uniref:DUF397 domain-containing protein n=1 Tax=Streptomyces sp. L-9-10 TaxID=1478131 RepID=UPI00101C5FD7|nr:DUF397 domain-containing protein [Streptomyces sp. L-9-10]RYJ28812.1 hypothetical protein CU044_2573 [Streptomyces sp. L-9-10]